MVMTVWSMLAECARQLDEPQRIRRLLTLPGQPSLHHAARRLGTRHAILTSQVRQLETTVGTALLRTGPDGWLTLTACGKLFARDVAPVRKMLSTGSARKGDPVTRQARP
jgi:DNA-binding transcriptional LysR family regulator